MAEFGINKITNLKPHKQMTTPTISQLMAASIHLFLPTLEEAKREAYRLGVPYFRTFINGTEMFTIRPRKEVGNG